MSNVPKYLKKLNRQQRRAVMHGLADGPRTDIDPLLVIAGAGTGKTRTLAYRFAHLVARGMDPSRILVLTFSRQAADEMSARIHSIVTQALSGREIDVPWSGTFHAVGAKLIRQYADRIGLDRRFTILDRSDAADLMNLVRQDLGLSRREAPFPTKDKCLEIYSFVANSGLGLREVLSTRYRAYAPLRRELRKLFRQYTATKRRQHVLDYDDLLLYWADLMDDAQIGAEIRTRFDHVLVDEYQDTNPVQAKILFLLKPNGRGLTVVGDDAQAIYSWRGATVRNILDFPASCRPRARIIVLERNYRSTQPILEAANYVMSFAAERYTKILFSKRRSTLRPGLTAVIEEREQAKYVVQQMLAAREAGVPLKAQAALFRASSHSTELELELARRGIPFVKYGGAKFLEAAHVKDVVSLLRWVENPNDRVAGFRVLQLLPRIGPGTAAKVLDKLAGGRLLAKALAIVEVPPSAGEGWRDFVRLIRRMRRNTSPWPSELQVVRRWYDPVLRKKYEDNDPEARLRDLDQLEQIASAYEARLQFLTDLALDPPEATERPANDGKRTEDYAVLSTVHSAKGREWQIVRILNAIDGCIPLDQAVDEEEERRLLHVAMTRAKNDLDIIVPKQMSPNRPNKFNGEQARGAITPFIPASIRDAFDSRRWRHKSGASAKRR